MHDRGESRAADVFDFVDEFLSDREKGRDLPLAHYLARYPRCQEEIAREYLALKAPPSDGPRSKVPGEPPSGLRNDAKRVGPYRILSEIGRGGQGAVFLAEDTRIARRVALKVLASRFDLVSEERRRRFRREAEVIARLEHPGICGIYEADIDGDTPYIAMRHVEGRSLAQILAEAREALADARKATKGGASARPATAAESDESTTWPARDPLDVRRALLLFERVARALHAAHEAGIVHRDVKPGNVMIARDGQPVLLDFGLARDEMSEVATLTQSGDVFGTPGYMSPEQLAGGGAPLDRRTDVYSLAISLYEALTLERPFEAPSRMELYRRILEEPVPDPRARNPALSEDVKVVLETALERDRGRRYATALEFAEDLRRIREYEPIRARPAGVLLRFSRWTQRHPVLAVAIIGTIVALSGGLAMALHLLEKRDAALAQAASALEIALGHHLAERCAALVPEDPAAALAVGIAAAEREVRQTGAEKGASYLTRSALFLALDACWLERVLSGEPARLVTDAAVSPDGSRVALATDRGVARVLDLETGATVLELGGHSGAIARIFYLRSGGRIATASQDGRVRLFDARSGKLALEMDAGEPLLEAEIAPDGSQLAAVGRSGRAFVWSTVTGERRFVLDQGPGGIAWVAFDPRDGARILSRASDSHAGAGAVTLWDARGGSRLQDLGFCATPIVACAFDPARDRVAAGCQGGDVHLLEIPTGTESSTPLRLASTPGFLAFSPDGRRMLVATDRGEEGEAFLVDVGTGELVHLAGHDGRRVVQHVVQGAFSPDGARVATTSFNRTVRVWDASSGAALRVFASRVRPVGVLWTPAGDRLLSWNNDHSANVWFARNRRDLFDLAGHSGPVVRARCSPDDRSALTASTDGTARLWSVPPPHPAPTDVDLEPGTLLQVFRHEGPVHDACYSPDGETVLTASADGTARIWSARSGEALGAPLVHPAAVVSATFDFRGVRILTVCADGKARIFTALSSQPPRVLDSGVGTIDCASFDPHGEIVACGSSGDAVEVWDATNGEHLRELGFIRREGGAGGVTALAFDPSGTELTAACGDMRLRHWNPWTGESTRLEASVPLTRSLSYSHDGLRLLVIGRFGSGAARVFRLDGGRGPVQAVVAHTASIAGGTLDSSGDLVLTFARDGTAHVWESETGLPVAYRAGRKAAILDGTFDGGRGNPRVITACEDGTVSVWPVDPLPAALARKPRELYPLEKAREQRLALPLRFE